MRFSLGKLVVLAAVAGLVAVGWTKHEHRVHEQRSLAAIASEIAGRPVGVHCPNFFTKLVNVSGEAGQVKFDDEGRPANYTDLSPQTCDELAKFKRIDFSCLDTHTCGDTQFQAAWAAHTLAHESFHLKGYEDEGVTECYAMQTTAFVAEQLGMSADRAEELQHWVWAKGYRNEPTDYQSSNCYPDGPLDLHPGSTNWP